MTFCIGFLQVNGNHSTEVTLLFSFRKDAGECLLGTKCLGECLHKWVTHRGVASPPAHALLMLGRTQVSISPVQRETDSLRLRDLLSVMQSQNVNPRPLFLYSSFLQYQLFRPFLNRTRIRGLVISGTFAWKSSVYIITYRLAYAYYLLVFIKLIILYRIILLLLSIDLNILM